MKSSVNLFYQSKKSRRRRRSGFYVTYTLVVFCIRNYKVKETSFQGKYFNAEAVSLGKVFDKVDLEYLEDHKAT